MIRPSTRDATGAGKFGLRPKLAGIYALLIAGNIAAWACAFLAFRGHPALLGTALIAYGLGARHAVDADHIAAIDNVTRKLMQQGDRPAAVGFYFSLGHSTVVALASAAIAAGASMIERRFSLFAGMGELVGTGISALFLFAIALANLLVARSLYRSFRNLRRSNGGDGASVEPVLTAPGLLRPVLRLVGASWHMYPLGILFGLGFDTATEVGVLGISAVGASSGLPIWSIMVFPALFTASMSLVDTSDSVLMLAAYGWAFREPRRKLYYNLAITFLSVVVAVVVGSIETLGLLVDRFDLGGGLSRLIAALNQHFDTLGCIIIALFVASWACSALLQRRNLPPSADQKR